MPESTERHFLVLKQSQSCPPSRCFATAVSSLLIFPLPFFSPMGRSASHPPCDHLRMEKKTPISIPSEIIALLEATALANDCKPEEIILAAIEAFLDSDREYQVEE